MADQSLNAPSTLPTDREIEAAIKRLTGASEHALNAGTGRIEIACCDPNDLRLLLSRLSSVEGELAGKQIDSSSVSQITNPLQVALNEHYPAYVRAEAERVMEIPDRTLHGAPSGDEGSVSTVSDPMLEEFTRLNDAWLAQQAKNRDLWIALVTITGHYDARSEIYTNDADLAEAMAGIARQALRPEQATQ